MASGLFSFFQMKRDCIKVEYPANSDGTIPTFYVGRQSPSNMAWTRCVEVETRQYRRQIELEQLDKLIEREINMRIFAKSLLPKVWENIQGEDGKLIEFNTENALALFRKLPEMYLDLNRQSLNLAAFVADEQEQAAKN